MDNDLLDPKTAVDRILRSANLGKQYHLNEDLEAELCIYGRFCPFATSDHHRPTAERIELMVDKLRLDLSKERSALAVGGIPTEIARAIFTHFKREADREGRGAGTKISYISLGGIAIGIDVNSVVNDLADAGLVTFDPNAPDLDIRVTEAGLLKTRAAVKRITKARESQAQLELHESKTIRIPVQLQGLEKDVERFMALDLRIRSILLYLAAIDSKDSDITRGELTDLIDNAGVPDPSRHADNLIKGRWLGTPYSSNSIWGGAPRYVLSIHTISRIVSYIANDEMQKNA